MAAKKKKKRHPVPPMSDERLREFIADAASGLLTMAWQVPENNLQMVFMPLFFGAMDDVDLSTVGMIYEHYNKAGPRSINGFPIFMSFHIINKEDWERARIAIDAELDRRKAIELPPKPTAPPARAPKPSRR